MKKNRFITGYSGLRALAVVGVILYHLDPNTFIGGYLGVPIFFVLSGYLVTDHMLKAYRQEGRYDNKRFYLQRIKRLYPQMLALLWICSSWILLFQRNLLPKLGQIVVTNILNVYNFWQILNGQSYFERFAANESPFTHLWTMSIEGQFYIVWPLVIFLLVKYARSRKRMFWILTTVSLISAAEMAVLFLMGSDINRIYYGTDTRFFSLGLGAAMAVIWPIEHLRSNITKSDSRILDLVGLGAFAGMLVMFFNSNLNPQAAFTYCGGMLLFSIFTTVLVAIIAHPGSHWNRFLTNPLFSWIGSRSYGIYLWQFPVMIFFEDKMRNIGEHVVLYHVIEVILIIILSEVSYRLIEKPFSKITWEKFKENITSTFDFNENNWLKKIKFVVAFLFFLVGSMAIISSKDAKSEDLNTSQLAQRINANQKEQKQDNKSVIRQYKTGKNTRSQSLSKVYSEAEKAAKKDPKNKSIEKYGISQVDIQLARKMNVTAIGDSVMAGSSNDLKRLMPKALIDAAVSRQLNVAFGLIDSYKQKGVLSKNVLIGLGTNGPFSMGDLDHLMDEVGKNRQVFWTNTHVPSRQWQGQVNDLLAQAAKKYNNLKVIDWYSYSKNHPDWFYDDQTHPTIEGSKYYSAFVVKSMVKYAKY